MNNTVSQSRIPRPVYNRSRRSINTDGSEKMYNKILIIVLLYVFLFRNNNDEKEK